MPVREKKKRREVRFTLLLTVADYALAKQVAASDYRSLPDFLRACIYERAAALRMGETKRPSGNASVSIATEKKGGA